MANWEHTIDVTHLWRVAEDTPDGWRAVATSAATQIEKLPGDDELTDIIEELREVAGDEVHTVHDFDVVWEALYDWGDAGHRLWIHK